MRRIKLSRGYYAQVSDRDYQRVMSGKKWFASVTPTTVYAMRHKTKADGSDTTEYLHIFIKGKKGVDHKDRNGLNCQRHNLRFATPTQNQANRKKHSNGITSKYKGVCWDSNRGRWMASTTARYKTVFLGRFSTAKQAALAYDTKARELYGKFAHTNF